MKKSSNLVFSIVIPTLNEEKYLPLLLRDLSKQSFSQFEVIVVDGSSEDKTVAKATLFEKRFPLTIIKTTKRNVSHQRNLGADKAKAPWVVFMDADNRLPVYFLTGLQYQVLKHPKVDCFTTWTHIKSTSQVQKMIERGINYGLTLGMNMGKPQALGALIGCRREVLKKVRFDEQQTIFEDSKFIEELQTGGYSFTVFREPQFWYSTRRLKKEGNLRTISIFLNNQTRYILGGDFSEPFSNKNYPMLGGGYYTEKKHTNVTLQGWLTNLEHSIRTASKKQLEQAQRTLRSLIDFEV
jgi:glycosyltransferase involved in cell wall biosynthesis